MKTIKLIFTAAVFIIASTIDADAQRFLDRVHKAAERAAERAVIRQAEKRTEDAVNDAIDDAFDGNENQQQQQQQPNQQNQQQGNAPAGSADASGNPQVAAGQAPQQTPEMTYAKSDFVAGDEIIFEDQTENEQLGEFPSQWDLLNGTAEVASYGGQKGIHLEVPSNTHIAPLMKEKNYLPEVFTVEFNFWVNGGAKSKADQNYNLQFFDPTEKKIATLQFGSCSYNGEMEMKLSYKAPNSDDTRYAEAKVTTSVYFANSWNRLSVSFNQRAFKAYVNGVRIVNVPNMKAPSNLSISQSIWGGFSGNKNAISNMRIAKGAVPLYDRMMSDGKFITYGITFDVGKSTIKPESMGEINRIVKLMTENADLKFSVEGHTDNTGNAAANQTLSEERSKAIVGKLIELGIAADRLTASGKGQNTPIADNGTDEGRAKNRRVEFVKL